MKKKQVTLIFLLLVILFGKSDAQVTLEWATRYNSQSNGSDYARELAIESAPHICIAGEEKDSTMFDSTQSVSYIIFSKLIKHRWKDPAEGLNFEKMKISQHPTIDKKNPYNNNQHILIKNFSFNDFVDTAWIRHYASELIPSEDAAYSVAVDPNNATVVAAGIVQDPLGGNDFFLIKYSKNGDTLWTRRYNGDTNSNDEVKRVRIDLAGNIIVSGSSRVGATYDYTTVKYDAFGKKLWVSRYSGHVTDMEVDIEGNIYVSGSSIGVSWDYATVKYDPNGKQLWVSRYNSSENQYASHDWCTAMTIDDSGNVYVTGGSATIKYNKMGDSLWVVEHATTAGLDIKVDKQENVFTAGFRMIGRYNFQDFITIKYNTDGTELWAAIYDGGSIDDEAKALIVDSVGNTYVAGNKDYEHSLIIKYDTNGNKIWITPFYQDNISGSYISDLSFDPTGNVVITGSCWLNAQYADYMVIKYDTSGTKLWCSTYDGPTSKNDYPSAIAIDENGYVYVTGRSEELDYDFATIKYDTDGDQLWVSRFNYTVISQDEAVAMTAADAEGNIYVTGKSWSKINGSDIITMKYDALGNKLWATRYIGKDDEPSAIAADIDGNVYVTGKGWGVYNDYLTIKYDVNGNELWTARYNGLDGGHDFATAITIDTKGNVYVTGASVDQSVSSSYATIKYNPDGNPVWLSRYTPLYQGGDIAKSLAVDELGNVSITGSSSNFGFGSGSDITTIKLDSSGNILWVARYNDTGNSNEEAVKILLDNAENIYVAGTSEGEGTFNDYVIIKYNSSGTLLWTARYNHKENDYLSSMAIDNIGNVFVTGKSWDGESSFDYATIKYDPSGNQIWVKRYDGTGNNIDYATDIKIDKYRNIYVAGSSSGKFSGLDFTTIKYDEHGILLWEFRYNGLYNNDDVTCSIFVDDTSNVFITGSSKYGINSIITTIKLKQAITSVQTDRSIPKSYKLNQNYPNPFNSSTVIEYQLPIIGFVILKVYDILGREVTTLVDELRQPGAYTVRWGAKGLSSGVYYYCLKVNNFTETKKLLLAK